MSWAPVWKRRSTAAKSDELLISARTCSSRQPSHDPEEVVNRDSSVLL